jgi:hypothetical protein
VAPFGLSGEPPAHGPGLRRTADDVDSRILQATTGVVRGIIENDTVAKIQGPGNEDSDSATEGIRGGTGVAACERNNVDIQVLHTATIRKGAEVVSR